MVYSVLGFTIGLVFVSVILARNSAHDVKTEINGSGAKFTQFKFAVFIYEINEYFSCSGALITNRHVLTVARYYSKIPAGCRNCNFGYCVAGDIYRFYKPLKSTWYRQKRLVESFRVHPKYYDSPRPIHDIAILTTKYKFFFTKYVGPINLANYALEPKDACVAVGFLDRNYGSPWPPKIDLTWFSARVTDAGCNHSGTVSATTARRSNPLGDYGGLLIENKLPPLLHGLLTEFLGTPRRPYGGVYFIVANHEEWIMNEISNGMRSSGNKRSNKLTKFMMFLHGAFVLILAFWMKYKF